jgi:hypothetical protein
VSSCLLGKQSTRVEWTDRDRQAFLGVGLDKVGAKNEHWVSSVGEPGQA